MSPQTWQTKDETARSEIGSVVGEELDNQITLLNDKFKVPFKVTVSGSSIVISIGKFNTLKSDGADGTTNSYVWRNSFFGNQDGAISNMSLNVFAGSASGPNGPLVCPTVTADNWIQLGIELRSDLQYHFVWGTENAVKGSTTPPRFSHGAIQVCIIYLQKDSFTGRWGETSPDAGFLNPVETDIEIMRFNKVHVTDLPVRMYSKRDAFIYFDPDEYTDHDGGGAKESLLGGLFPTVASSHYRLNGGSNPETNGNNFVGTPARPTVTAGRFIRVGFTLMGNGDINVIWSADEASEGSLADPATLFEPKGFPIGWIDLESEGNGNFKTIYSDTGKIEPASANLSTNPTAMKSRIHRVLNANVNPEDYVRDEIYGINNIVVQASASTPQLTISAKTTGLGNFSTKNKGFIQFRHTTSASGHNRLVVLTSSVTDLVMPTGSNLGLRLGATSVFFYVYAVYIDNTSIALGVCSHQLDEGDSHTAVDISSGTANLAKTLYVATANAGAGKRIRCIGMIRGTKDVSEQWTAISSVSSSPQGNINRQNSFISASINDYVDWKENTTSQPAPISGHYRMTTDSYNWISNNNPQFMYQKPDGTQIPFLDQKHLSPVEGLHNIAIASSVASGGAFTLTLRGSSGQNLGTSNHGVIVVRNTTTSSAGDTYPIILSQNYTVTVDSGATFGLPNGVTSRLYVYAMYTGLTSIALAVSASILNDDDTDDAVALDANADTFTELYSDFVVSTTVKRLIGYVEAVHTNGTWSTPTKLYCGLVSSVSSMVQTSKKYDNLIINGGMDIWNRALDFNPPTSGANIADRWMYFKSGSQVNRIQRSTTVPTVSSNTPVYSMTLETITVASSVGASDFALISQYLEGYEYERLRGKSCILSFWFFAARANLTFGVSFQPRDGSSSYVVNFSPPSGWSQVVIPVTFNDSIGTWASGVSSTLFIAITLIAGSTYLTSTQGQWVAGNKLAATGITNNMLNATDDHYITQVMLQEIGERWSADDLIFQYYGGSVKSDLIASQRYFLKLQYVNSGGASMIGPFVYTNTNTLVHFVPGSWGFRAAPTLVLPSGLTYSVKRDDGVDVTASVTGFNAPYGSENLLGLRLQSAGAWSNSFQYYLVISSSSPNWLGFNAELS